MDQKRIKLITISITLSIILTMVFVAAPSAEPYVMNQCLVRFHSDIKYSGIETFLYNTGTKIAYQSQWSDWKAVEFPDDIDPVNDCAALAGSPEILDAGPNAIAWPLDDPNDEFYYLQWNLPQININKVWSYTEGASNITVAVLDTGDYPNHPDIQDVTRVPGYDFADNDNDPTDPFSRSHGAHVSSIIFATRNNQIGISGIIPNFRLMPVRVIGAGGGTAAQIADGIHYAIENGANVINMSFGFDVVNGVPVDPGTALAEAVQAAADAGIVIVAAAGNTGQNVVVYPAAYNEVVAVGASDILGNRTSYSNYGDKLELLAPGGLKYMDLNHDGNMDGIWGVSYEVNQFTYQMYQGTSQASPHVAALAAILLHNDLPANQARIIMQQTALDLNAPGRDNETGYGLVDFEKALSVIGFVEKTDLLPAYPNPFTHQTAISYSLKTAGNVEVAIYNVAGNKVKTIFNDQKAPGIYEINWDGTNKHNEKVASGLYFACLKSKDKTQFGKIVFLNGNK